MRVAVVAEFYPRAADPVLGVWAHRQAIAARDAGADVRVLVLHRPLPPLAALRDGPRAAAGAAQAPHDPYARGRGGETNRTYSTSIPSTVDRCGWRSRRRVSRARSRGAVDSGGIGR